MGFYKEVTEVQKQIMPCPKCKEQIARHDGTTLHHSLNCPNCKALLKCFVPEGTTSTPYGWKWLVVPVIVRPGLSRNVAVGVK